MFHQFLSLSRSLSFSIAFLRENTQGGKWKYNAYMWQNIYFFIFTWLRSVQNWINRFMRNTMMSRRHQQYTSHIAQRQKYENVLEIEKHSAKNYGKPVFVSIIRW